MLLFYVVNIICIMTSQKVHYHDGCDCECKLSDEKHVVLYFTLWTPLNIEPFLIPYHVYKSQRLPDYLLG